jgi:hypothetical protein
MISLSELLGGRRKSRRRKTTRRRGAGLVGGRKKRRTRRSRSVGRGLVGGRPRKRRVGRPRKRRGGDLALANAYQMLAGGAIGADPAVLNYYQKLAQRGGGYEDYYDPESVSYALKEWENKGNLARRTDRLKELKGWYDVKNVNAYLKSIPAPILNPRRLISDSAKLVDAARLQAAKTQLANDYIEEMKFYKKG